MIKPVEIIFKDYILKFAFLPFILTIIVVLLIIGITITLVLKEVRDENEKH